jgi:23S rRNA (uracil1939-C5)-methyltransferase
MEFSFGRKWHLADPKVKKEPMLSSSGKRRSRKNKSYQATRLDTATPLVAEEKEYVNRPETPTKRDYALGLHVPARFDRIVEISECHVQEPVGNEILQFIRSRCEDLKLEAYDSVNASGYMRNVGIRSARNAADELEIMVNLMTGLCEVPGRLVPLAEELLSKFPTIVSVVQNMPSVASNVAVDPSLQRLLAGERAYLEQKLCGLSFEISANSFFQTNSYQAEKLYNEARFVAQLKPDDVLLDLFCGTGSIGLTMASHCRKVVGIELVADAVADAKRNAKRNKITNAEFAVGDLLRLKDSPIPLLGKEQPDVIVVDPPRAGLHKDVVKFLSKTMARRIVYVSCNPATQVKDLAYLLELAPGKFAIDCVRPVDMFPHTPHIECIVGISSLQI